MIRTFSPLCGVFIASCAVAQTLPPPAPLADSQTPPRPTPTPFVLENPPSFEEPIIIGEPVRAQKTPGPKIAPKQAAPKPGRAKIAAPKKVVVANVDVTGLSDSRALAKLKSSLAESLQQPVRMVVGEYQYTFLRAELGAQIPYAALLKAARESGTAPLRFEVEPKRLELSLRELDGLVRDDFEGTALNVGGTRARILAALQSPAQSRIETLVTRAAPSVPEPRETPRVVQNPTGSGAFPYLHASFSTRYDAKLRGRTTNLKMAARNIDGTIIAPGKIFSTNLAIGPRNASAGWKEAKMFVSGRVVSGTGSGICQAASTLYNAALLADFPIVERHAHSMRVTYVPPSQDAALMWGSKDFKFRNDSGGALKIQTKVSGGQFHAWIWGEKPKSAPPIQLVSTVVSRRGGTKSEAYKVVGGKKIRLSRDFYRPVP